MKKTVKTAMTAAMFAASLGAAAGNAQGACAFGQNAAVMDFEETSTAIATVQTVYGPPDVMQSMFGTTTTEEDPYDFTGTEIQDVYGPPSVMFDPGDINMDKSLDARDISILKSMILDGLTSVSWGQLGDLTGDGELSKEDIKALERQLTGKPEDEDENKDETGYEGTMTSTATTATVPDWDETIIPQPAYGPPEWFE